MSGCPMREGCPMRGRSENFYFQGGFPYEGGGGIFKREVHTPLHTTGIVGA